MSSEEGASHVRQSGPTFISRREPPHIRFFDSRYRGYGLCDITGGSWRTKFRAVEHVRDRIASARTLAEFVVEHGRPDAQMA